MDWIAHPDNKTHFEDPGGFYIIIVLADISTLGIQRKSNHSVNFNHTVQEMATVIERGMPLLRVHGSFIHVKSLAMCFDKFCDQSEILVSSKNPPKAGDSSRCSVGIAVFLIVLTIAFISKHDSLL